MYRYGQISTRAGNGIVDQYCSDVELAIDYAFNDNKFVINFYQYLKGKDATRNDAKSFLNSSTASNIKEQIEELDEYLKGGQDDLHKMFREAYGHLPKPYARKIRNYLSQIISDAEKYIYDKRPGRRKKVESK